MHKLRRPTEMYRATVDRNVRIIVGIEPNASPSAVRRVRLLVPPSPAVSAALDITPEEVGANREYKMPTLPPGQVVFFDIAGQQFLVAVAGTEYAELAVIVEYRD